MQQMLPRPVDYAPSRISSSLPLLVACSGARLSDSGDDVLRRRLARGSYRTMERRRLPGFADELPSVLLGDRERRAGLGEGLRPLRALAYGASASWSDGGGDLRRRRGLDERWRRLGGLLERDGVPFLRWRRCLSGGDRLSEAWLGDRLRQR